MEQIIIGEYDNTGDYENENIDDVLIKLSVGIGKNLLEAEQALKKAKQNKEESNRYNIVLYNEEPIEMVNQNDCNIATDAYFRLEQKLKYFDNALEDLESLKYDSKTGLLNRMGYSIELKKLRNKENRHIILIDCDNLHNLNEEFTYDWVDKYLEQVGKALNSTIRTKTDNNRETDIVRKNYRTLNHRKNDCAGDEFIINLDCPKEHLVNVAKRYIDIAYQYQKQIKNVKD